MNGTIRAAILGSQSHCSHLQNALFHSSPVLERKRRTSWESKANVYNKRYRRRREKQALLRNVSAFADHLFGSWHDEFDKNDQSSSRHSSWFKKQYCKGSRRNSSSKCGPQSWGKRRFEFCEDDDELEIDYIFRSAFGGSRGFFWSFTHEEEDPQRRYSSRYTNYFRRSCNSRYHEDDDDEDEDEDEYEGGYSSTEYNDSDSSQASHRLALGLSPSGPLNLVDVKNAYRDCALKWHPDRHQGSSKAVAEEKFKLCSVAYQSLCEKLAVS